MEGGGGRTGGQTEMRRKEREQGWEGEEGGREGRRK